MIATLNIFQSVGNFILNSNIKDYIEKYPFEINDYTYEQNAPAVHYSLDNPKLTLFVENNIIKEIACYEELLYRGRNLIGMGIEELISHTGENYEGEIDCLDFEDDNIPQFVYEFESMGLQVWVKGKQGRIVTIIVSSDG